MAAALLATALGPAEPIRLTGLDRLYFERMTDPAEAETCGPEVSRLLPARLEESATAATEEDGLCDEFESRDFDLPASGALRLRQVVDRNHPRIAVQYWAVYEGGVRSDLWWFAPLPERTGGKLLSPYEVSVVEATPDGFVLRTCGIMVRPHGAWWARGSDLAFTASGGKIAYRSIGLRFAAGREADLGDEPVPRAWLRTERTDAARGIVETREVAALPAVQQACGFGENLEDAGCDDLERFARCATARPEAEVGTGPAGEPPFPERAHRIRPPETR
jgi:hypothetical protein